MPQTDKAKVRPKENNASLERDGPKLLIEHKAFSYKTKDGRTIRVKAHVEVNPQLSPSRKKEALRLKAELEVKEQPAAKPARKPRAKKEAAHDGAAPRPAVGEGNA